MGQTSSSSQVDYTFGVVADSSDKTNNTTPYKEEDDNAFSSWTANERLLRYPQHYGLENDSSATGYESDDELGSHRLSIPSTSSACSMPLVNYQHRVPFFRTLSSSPPPSQHNNNNNNNSNNNDDDDEKKHTIDRIDSGYADQDVFEPKKEPMTTTSLLINQRLAQDIHYVDQLYYATVNTNSKKMRHQRNEFDLFTTTNDNTLALTTGPLDDDGTAAYHDDNANNGDDNYNDGDDDITIGTKLTFAAAALASQDPTMRDICLSRRSLIHLDSNIALLTSIRKLNLCSNMLTELPDSIGQLKQLEVLTISENRLRHLPDAIQYLPRLIELDVSHNQLQHLPSLSHLSSLCTLLLSHNRLTRLPSDLTGLKRLVTMDLTHNPLTVLPAEITHLSNLRRIRLDNCQKLLNTDEHAKMEVDLTHDPPSLLEICARNILVSLSSSSSTATTGNNNNNNKTRHLGISPAAAATTTTTTSKLLSRLPGSLLSYLASANICSSCHGPYFESHVVRRRLIEKNELWIPLEYTLCSAHWSDEMDRLRNMFHRSNSDSGDHSMMINTIASLHSLMEQQQQQQRQQLSPSTSLCMDMDDLDTKPTGRLMTSLWRHPQRLQRVRNNNSDSNKAPSSFLIPKINRG